MAVTKDEILAALAEALAPKAKKSKKEPKYVIVVDGKVLQSRPSNKTELEQAVVAIKLKNPSSKVIAYKLEGELSIELPVGGITTDVEGE